MFCAIARLPSIPELQNSLVIKEDKQTFEIKGLCDEEDS